MVFVSAILGHLAEEFLPRQLTDHAVPIRLHDKHFIDLGGDV
jgi:hypothetical protein